MWWIVTAGDPNFQTFVWCNMYKRNYIYFYFFKIIIFYVHFFILFIYVFFFKIFFLYLLMINRLYVIINKLYTIINNLFIKKNNIFVNNFKNRYKVKQKLKTTKPNIYTYRHTHVQIYSYIKRIRQVVGFVLNCEAGVNWTDSDNNMWEFITRNKIVNLFYHCLIIYGRICWSLQVINSCIIRVHG